MQALIFKSDAFGTSSEAAGLKLTVSVSAATPGNFITTIPSYGNS